MLLLELSASFILYKDVSLKETSVGSSTASTPASVVTVTTDISEVGGKFRACPVEVRRLVPIRTVRRHGCRFLRLRTIGPHERVSNRGAAFLQVSVAIKRGTLGLDEQGLIKSPLN